MTKQTERINTFGLLAQLRRMNTEWHLGYSPREGHYCHVWLPAALGGNYLASGRDKIMGRAIKQALVEVERIRQAETGG